MKNRNSSSETSERGVCHGCLLKELYGQWMLEPFRGGRDHEEKKGPEACGRDGVRAGAYKAPSID